MQLGPVRLRAFALSLAASLAGCQAHESQRCGNGEAPHATSRPVAAAPLPSSFRWRSSDPVITAHADATHRLLSIKDPTVVFFEGRWHVFATTANASGGAWSMVYLSFADWSEAQTAEQHYLGDLPNFQGYHCAPQVFFFRPQHRWYLVFQSGQPQYTTTTDLAQPSSWAPPRDFFASEPASVREHKGAGAWLDFSVICDEQSCYLFFTDDNGDFFRSRTRIEDFPNGFDEPVIAMQGTKATLFEASQTYRVEGTNRYLTTVEAFGPAGQRFFRSFAADRLDGEWAPLAATWDNPFAGSSNVTFASGRAWTNDISHGELIRTNYDETPTISLHDLRFLYQGVDASVTQGDYFQIPWQLALLTRIE